MCRLGNNQFNRVLLLGSSHLPVVFGVYLVVYITCFWWEQSTATQGSITSCTSLWHSNMCMQRDRQAEHRAINLCLLFGTPKGMQQSYEKSIVCNLYFIILVCMQQRRESQIDATVNLGVSAGTEKPRAPTLRIPYSVLRTLHSRLNIC